MAKKKQSTAEIKRHWDFLSNEVGCMISHSSPATIHHACSGSMKDRGFHRGKSQKISDWLTIPLAEIYHTGKFGIDAGMGKYSGVLTWEKQFGKQADFIDKLCEITSIDLWERARNDH